MSLVEPIEDGYDSAIMAVEQALVVEAGDSMRKLVAEEGASLRFRQEMNTSRCVKKGSVVQEP